MSYRLDSDILTPHGSVQPFEILGNHNVNRNEDFGVKHSYLAKKTKVKSEFQIQDYLGVNFFVTLR